MTHRFDRASWLTVAFVLGFAAVCALVTALLLSEPGDGCLLDANNGGSTVYACVGGWATPLRPGDRILDVAGVRLGQERIMQETSALPAGPAEAATLPYSVERAGERLTLAVPLGRLDGLGLLRAFGAGLAFYANGWLVYVFIGSAVIFALAPRARAAQLLLLASSGGAAVVTLTWTAESVSSQLFASAPLRYGAVALGTFWGWLLAPTLLLLVLSFPRRVWPLARWPRATPVLFYGLPLAALAAMLITGREEFYLATLGLGAFGFLAATIAVTAHTFRRGRDPVARAQTAWMGLGLMVGIGLYPALFVLGFAVPWLDSALETAPWLNSLLELFTSASFAVCLGIAITRYRLFEIDVIINRALVYTLLTGALAAVYVGGVALVQGLFRALTGQESDLAIVASTLAAAACFQPLRGWIHAFIDRRFYRRKYDAARILAAYGAALRDDAELETLRDELLWVADETMRPAHVALWLREADGQE